MGKKFQSIEKSIKNGQVIKIREAVEADASKICECIKAFVKNNEGQVWEPGEFAPTEDQQRNTIKSILKSENEILLIAESNGNILGTIDFQIGKRNRIKHSGEFGMSVMPASRGLGLGAALLDVMINWTRSNPRIEKMTLRVISTNSRAIELYKKFGFQEEGRHVRGLKYLDGSYADFIFMGLDVRS